MPSDRQAVGAVGRELERDQRVVERQRLAQRSRADRRDRRSSASRPAASSRCRAPCAEHSMPRDSTPRTVAFLIASPPGSVAPTSAQGTFMPGRGIGRAADDLQRRRGRRHRPCTRAAGRRPDAARPRRCVATTTPEKGGAAASISSTSRPAIVSASQSRRCQAADRRARAASVRRISWVRPIRRTAQEAQSFSKNRRRSFTP